MNAGIGDHPARIHPQQIAVLAGAITHIDAAVLCAGDAEAQINGRALADAIRPRHNEGIVAALNLVETVEVGREDDLTAVGDDHQVAGGIRAVTHKKHG